MKTLSVLSPSRSRQTQAVSRFPSGLVLSRRQWTVDHWRWAREGWVARLPDLQLDLASELAGCGLLEARRQLPVPIRVLFEGKSLKAHGWACSGFLCSARLPWRSRESHGLLLSPSPLPGFAVGPFHLCKLRPLSRPFPIAFRRTTHGCVRSAPTTRRHRRMNIFLPLQIRPRNVNNHVESWHEDENAVAGSSASTVPQDPTNPPSAPRLTPSVFTPRTETGARDSEMGLVQACNHSTRFRMLPAESPLVPLCLWPHIEGPAPMATQTERSQSSQHPTQPGQPQIVGVFPPRHANKRVCRIPSRLFWDPLQGRASAILAAQG